ncbi:MAG: 3-phosphoshikimate 1-carboxyvinyltransferase [Alkaliphilus sp.]|nr:3-phosphoshikimate 1-carboxyvinyltransferase [Alkaliphilus sp. AH-315-G20]MBN4067625.1 3-phosphoshikimate 1-carboxyvinyltransferase [Alkaliphilus transvaalensis]PHS34873.1 MAG: 3-phosphoshikimate 1-carboxyvinyltransferase [Alkaliphilus sp.]
MHVKIIPKVLKGTVSVPPSKSISHRAIIAASLAKGKSKISNLIFSEDIKATCNAMNAFGITIDKSSSSADIFSQGKLNTPMHSIDCHESGSTLRFLVPFCTLVDEPFVFNGKGKLKTRPLDPYFKIFKEQNIYYAYNDGLPLVVEGKLKPGKYEIRGDISSQFITGLMFVLPLLNDDSEIVLTTPLESKGYINLTIDVLNKFNIKIENDEHQRYLIKGNQKFLSRELQIEGDYSQAAFWIVAGLIGGDIEINGLNINSIQGDSEIVDIVKRMNGKIEIKDDSIFVSQSKTIGTTIDASQCPDIIPILTVLAALSNGKTEIVNASRLRIKESDRLKAITTELNKLGAQIIEQPEGLVIYGRKRLTGGVVDSWNDHRIAMSLAIASIRCKDEVKITNSQAIDKSYPHFFEHFRDLGGKICE